MRPYRTTREPTQGDSHSSESRWRPRDSESEPKIRQKRNVSSAAAEQTVVPSGDTTICSTRAV